MQLRPHGLVTRVMLTEKCIKSRKRKSPPEWVPFNELVRRTSFQSRFSRCGLRRFLPFESASDLSCELLCRCHAVTSAGNGSVDYQEMRTFSYDGFGCSHRPLPGRPAVHWRPDSQRNFQQGIQLRFSAEKIEFLRRANDAVHTDVFRIARELQDACLGRIAEDQVGVVLFERRQHRHRERKRLAPCLLPQLSSRRCLPMHGR